MNVSFPDNSSISILVLPAGAESSAIGDDAPRRLLALPGRSSRRRDLLLFGAGGLLCFAVLSVVRPHAPALPSIEPVHAAQQPGRAELPDLAAPSAEAQAKLNADAQASVRRLLAQPPTVIPPPGAPAAPRPSTGATTVGGGKPNAFGMSD